ncbi:radical SAM protein [Paenibacillus thiaminolyticus]|uniref:Radical SAM protein n=1 Tax=Paenibacillus thiaminolyticus TaxID=49283 RepID=A0A3A3GMR8_PANTH|nr:radical SAM protein [Paenibacillus thiaminolyticus]RJG26174.1 radical SAM protein [Paenibacillus thiaminolyticus]
MSKINSLNRRTYPGFPEYILLDLIGEGDTFFKRGAKPEFLYHPHFEQWHRYFCGPDYHPPAGKTIAFFQTCTWSKPYDFSYIGRKIRTVTDKYPNVHPIILSNAGVIPYEYQMNPTFCAYDWIVEEEAEREAERSVAEQYQEVTLKRIRNYLTANRQVYDSVVHYCMPVTQSMSSHIQNICKELGLPYYLAVSADVYRAVRERLLQLRDVGQFYIFDEVLASLKQILEKVSERYGFGDSHPGVQ